MEMMIKVSDLSKIDIIYNFIPDQLKSKNYKEYE